MPITRIKNNQVTDASAGNLYLGINAAVKLQDYSVTAGKIANSLVYGSDLTVTGNLTVNGQTTTIDTVSVVIEDPILYLAANQTGSPSLDIGFIGERGTSQNIAFVWDESLGEFVTVYTNDTTTNTTVTIASYASFRTLNAAVTGNLTVTGTTSLTGNISLGNVSATGLINATGNITGGNLVSNAMVSAATTINATGNINGGNLVSNAAISAATTINATGNITGGNLVSNAAITAATTINATGNITGGNLTTAGTANIGTLAVTGTTSLTGNVTSALNVTGNIAGGNIATNGQVTAVGNITGGNIIANGAVLGNIQVSGNINVTNVVATGFGSFGTTVSATGNITGGNLISNAAISGATLTTTGNALIGGNLIVQGNLTYINIDDLRVEDPVIIMGTGPNGAPLTTDDGMDRGIYMEYYKSGALGNASVFWDNSTGNLVAATGVNFTGNNIINVLQYGSFQTGNLYATGNITATANIAGNFVAPGSNTQVMYNNNGLIAGDAGMTYNASTDALTVVGNISGGNLSAGAGTITTTGNVNAGNVNVTNRLGATTGYFTGNVDILGTLTATSNVIANTSGIFFGNSVTGNAAIFGGVPGFTTLGSNVVIQFAGNANSYSQVNFENINGGNAASTDYVATANNGDDGTFFINMGITSNNHTGIHDNFFTEHATNNTGYVYVVASDETGPGSSGIGNLLLGSTNGNVLTWVGNTGAANVRTVASTQGFDIVNGNLYVTSIDSRSGRITVNASDADVDFAVDGDTTANLLYVDAGTGTTSFGNSTQTTGAGVAFNYTNSILAPVGNTAQRPGTGVAGMVRFNTTTSSLEFYDSTQWVSTGTIFTVVQSQTFNGDGSQVNFTINSGYTTVSCLVSINGILQVPVTAYAVSGTTLTFTEAPAIGDLIEVRQITTTVAVKGITNANGSAVVEVTDTTDYVAITGNVLPSGNVLYNLGSPTNQWNELFISGNSIYIGDVILKASAGNLKVRNFDDTADAGVEGTFISTSTTSGNLQIGFNHIEATNLNGNIELRPNGTGKVVVGTSPVTRLQVANIQIADAGSNTVVFYRADGTTPATISNQNIDSTQIASGTSSMAVIASGGNIRANVGGATIATFWSGGINNGQANGVGNIGTATSYFNTVFAKATSAQYADLAENYEADATYEPGTVVCFGGAKEVTVCDAADSTRVAGVISTNPSYLMNSGQAGEHVAAVALQGRVPCKVTGQIRKGDLIVSAGDGRGRANNDARTGTIIGKALADFDGQDGVIEVVVGRV